MPDRRVGSRDGDRLGRSGFPRPTVLLADGHPVVIEGLKKILGTDCAVVGEVADGFALLAAVKRLRPDLVIADVAMPGIDGVEAILRLRASVPETHVLILSDHTEPSWVQAAFAAGACGYLTKSSSATEIEAAVREVLQGRFYISPVVVEAAVQPALLRRERAPPAAAEPLTPREIDIAHLVGEGLGNKEIACKLGVSVTTIRSHLTNVYGKLGSTSRVALALLFALERREA